MFNSNHITMQSDDFALWKLRIGIATCIFMMFHGFQVAFGKTKIKKEQKDQKNTG